MWKYLLLLFFMGLGSTISAQPAGQGRDDMREKRHERIRQARQAFIAEQLELSKAEVAAFFPVFWSYQEELEKTKREGIRGRRSPSPDRGVSTMTEAEAKAAILKLQLKRKRLAELNVEAENKYLEILSARKVLKLELAERAFRETLWERMGRHRKRN